MKAALIYGTCTGRTEYVAEQIIEALKPEIELEMVDVYKIKAADLAQWEFMLCGIPTWDVGELEYGWADVYDNLDDVDLPNSTVAMFGLGDQGSYADTYQDAMGILYKKMLERGATGNVGFWPTEGYEFDASEAIIDGEFCGLAIDQDCQAELTDERLEQWCQVLKQHLQKQAA